MNDGYRDADEVSFAAMVTTQDFLGSLSSRDEKMDPYHDGRQETREVEKKERKRRQINKGKSQKIHFMNHP